MTPVAAVAPSSLSSPSRPRAPRSRFLEPAVLGVLVFMGSEIMFFSGMLSAYNIARARVPMSIWPPPDQPRLPVEATAVNSAFLLVSGILVWLAVRALSKSNAGAALKLAIAGAVTGAVFVVGQGYEWTQLLGQGLNMQRSAHASFFYMIVGTHALHVVGGLVGLGLVLRKMLQGTATLAQLRAAWLFWSFVVLVWPVIYLMVYL
jgi:cytochrome c oxidase subunit III